MLLPRKFRAANVPFCTYFSNISKENMKVS